MQKTSVALEPTACNCLALRQAASWIVNANTYRRSPSGKRPIAPTLLHTRLAVSLRQKWTIRQRFAAFVVSCFRRYIDASVIVASGLALQ
jgi:hypothetical protein